MKDSEATISNIQFNTGLLEKNYRNLNLYRWNFEVFCFLLLSWCVPQIVENLRLLGCPLLLLLLWLEANHWQPRCLFCLGLYPLMVGWFQLFVEV